MRALGAMVIILGFIIAWALFAIYWAGYQAKRLASKEGRAEIKEEVSRNVKFVATDKDFHKGLREEFRPLIILLGILGFVLLLSALGIN